MHLPPPPPPAHQGTVLPGVLQPVSSQGFQRSAGVPSLLHGWKTEAHPGLRVSIPGTEPVLWTRV